MKKVFFHFLTNFLGLVGFLIAAGIFYRIFLPEVLVAYSRHGLIGLIVLIVAYAGLITSTEYMIAAVKQFRSGK